jgi:hypothetical protein
VFAVAIAVVVLAFVIAGVAALQATSRINRWRCPDEEERLVRMASEGVAEARIARATALLRAYGENCELAGWKIHRTTLAARWFRRALLLLVGFSVLFVAYVVCAG